MVARCRGPLREADTLLPALVYTSLLLALSVSLYALPAPGGAPAACPLLVYAGLPGNASAPVVLLCTLSLNGPLGEPRGLALVARLGLAPGLYSGDIVLGVGVKTFRVKTVCLKILGYTASSLVGINVSSLKAAGKWPCMLLLFGGGRQGSLAVFPAWIPLALAYITLASAALFTGLQALSRLRLLGDTVYLKALAAGIDEAVDYIVLSGVSAATLAYLLAVAGYPAASIHAATAVGIAAAGGLLALTAQALKKRGHVARRSIAATALPLLAVLWAAGQHQAATILLKPMILIVVLIDNVLYMVGRSTGLASRALVLVLLLFYLASSGLLAATLELTLLLLLALVAAAPMLSILLEARASSPSRLKQWIWRLLALINTSIALGTALLYVNTGIKLGPSLAFLAAALGAAAVAGLAAKTRLVTAITVGMGLPALAFYAAAGLHSTTAYIASGLPIAAVLLLYWRSREAAGSSPLSVGGTAAALTMLLLSLAFNTMQLMLANTIGWIDNSLANTIWALLWLTLIPLAVATAYTAHNLNTLKSACREQNNAYM